jgi:hypothetical protein
LKTEVTSELLEGAGCKVKQRHGNEDGKVLWKESGKTKDTDEHSPLRFSMISECTTALGVWG